MDDKIQLFEDKRIRTAWDEEEEEWYFSVVDVVSILTDQATPRSASTYWAVLKKRLIGEGAQLLTNCKQLKMKVKNSGKSKSFLYVGPALEQLMFSNAPFVLQYHLLVVIYFDKNLPIIYQQQVPIF